MKIFTKSIIFYKVLLVAILLVSAFTQAQTTASPVDFTSRFSEAVNGDFTIIANNTISRTATDSYTGGTDNHNTSNNNLVYVDIDGNTGIGANTFNSSSATFNNPAPSAGCLTLKKVFLYWAAADREPGPDFASDNQPSWNYNDVLLMLPGETDYTTYTATGSEIIYRGRDTHFSNEPYICVKDITTEVNNLADPYQTYQVANVEGKIGSLSDHSGTPIGVSGGWQIVFVYESPDLPLKNISIFNGYAHVDAADSGDIVFSGFETVPSGDVNAKVLIGALEGDQSLGGDALQIEDTSGTFIDLSTNPTTPIREEDNFFNSRITINNADFTTRNPASTNTLGFDAAVFELSNPSNSVIGNGQNTATFNLTSDLEVYGLYLLGLSVEVWEPDLGPINVIVTSPGTPSPGDIINSSFNVANKGNDDAKNLRIFETLPPQLISTLPPTATPLPHPTVTGVTYQYNETTNLIEFFVDDSLVIAGSTSFNVNFDLQIRDTCYFLETNCDLQFEVQFEGTYNGVINTQQQSTLSSATEDPCSVSGVEDPLVINVNQPTVDWQTTIGILDRTIQCNDSAGLISAQALEPAANKCTFTPIKNSGSFIPDAGCPSSGTYTNTWNFTDACGVTISDFVQTITVINTTSISLPSDGASTVDCIADATETFTLPTVTDACGNTLTPSAAVITENPNPLTCEGTRTYTYTYTDCANNSDTWAYVYTIVTPAFTIAATDGTSTVDCRNDATSSGVIFPTVIDSCNNTLTPSAPIITFNPDPLTCEGTRTYTYTYTDCAGNSDTWDFIYTIDTPDFTIAAADGASTVDCIADADGLAIVLPTITNVCGSTLTPSAAVITENPNPLTCEGTRTYTYTYTDCANNSDTWAYVYTIDTPAFTIAATDGASTVDCIADATETFTLPAVTDVCGNTLTPSAAVITENPNPLTCEGTRTYTYTYTDCANNSDTWAYVYTIDTPTFTIAATDGASTVDCIADATQPTAPVVTDVCGNDITPVITENTDPICEGDKIYTFTYTDCAGNASVFVYTYTIDVTTAPVVPTNAGSTVECIADATQPNAPVVTDVCGNDITPVITENTDPICEGDKIYTFTYTDCAGNASVYVYTYTIDLTPFILPSNGVETVDNLADAIAPTPPTVTDNCGNAITPSAPTVSATPVCQGSIVYTFTYIDCAGNSADWAYTYTIELAPFTVPASDGTTVECIADATAPIPPVVVDANGDDVIPVMTENTDPICEGDKIYTFTYTDCAGNAGVWEYTYTIDVTTAPVVPTNAGSIVDCIADATQPTAPVVTDVCGNDITPVITENTDPICEGDKIYTFTYTDCAGNASVFVYTYSVKDTTPPVLSLPANITAECSDDLSPINFGMATATDNCDSDPVITFNDVRIDGDCPGTYTITRTWTATDNCGNSIDENQLIELSDTTAPEFDQTTLPANTVVECDNIPEEEVLTASDNCGTAGVTVNDERVDGNCPNSYEIKRSYTATDECGLTTTHVQTITVQDTTPPVFVETLPITRIVAQCDAIPVPEILTATDVCGSATVSVSDARTDGNCPNSYTLARTWVATDECGLTTTHTQIIIVQDTTPPAFVESLPRDTTVECDSIPDALTLTATDNCGDATVSVSDSRIEGNCPSNYEIVRTWIATDECGLTTTHIQTITVQDTTAPTPTSSFEATLDVSCAFIPEAPEVEFTDNCSSNVIIDFNETNTFDESVIADYQIIRTWTVRDACNNEAVYSQTLNVALDEILNEVVAEDICFDNGVVNLDNFLADDVYGGIWEIVEGNPIATVNGSIFDPTNLEAAYSESFNPNTDGIQYVLRYTGFQTGCINITDVVMIVDASCKVLPCGEKDISISTAITPNGDDFNKTFDIEGITLCGFVAEVKIFNRWGALVYESNEYTLGSEREGNAFGAFGKWDGSSTKSSFGNNGRLPNGTYYYIINLRNSGLDPITGPVYLGTK